MTVLAHHHLSLKENEICEICDKMSEIRVFELSKVFIQFCNVCTNGRFRCLKFRAKQCYILHASSGWFGPKNSTKASLVW